MAEQLPRSYDHKRIAVLLLHSFRSRHLPGQKQIHCHQPYVSVPTCCIAVADDPLSLKQLRTILFSVSYRECKTTSNHCCNFSKLVSKFLRRPKISVAELDKFELSLKLPKNITGCRHSNVSDPSLAAEVRNAPSINRR